MPAERISEIGSVQPGIALGVAPGQKADDYRLAVRIQHQDFLSGSRVPAIVDAAKGEADVQYVGLLFKQTSGAATGYRRRTRPIHPGISAGHYAITAGTLGAIVRMRADSRARILSNNHVLADENRGVKGDSILQPGSIDGGIASKHGVAALEDFVILHVDRTNVVDAAVALIDEDVSFDPTFPKLGTIRGLADVDKAKHVVKVGRTTGLTRGRVTAIEVDDVVVKFDAGLMRFDGQIEVSGADGRPFSLGGDSGSLVVDADSTSALGLLFAGSDTGGPDGVGVTYVNPLDFVFRELSIEELW
ncbi:hypothetical protein A5708_21175 [Mycobacterium colombiense]|uniref:Nal1 C-terminal domain-containing protein n=1 Tax=Mycobacterium colombiense TaxID=339268 RepID=A0A1A2YYI0_9MYCO|nr:hypothetical protein A5708_21175 [Mycobacterium colombiense]